MGIFRYHSIGFKIIFTSTILAAVFLGVSFVYTVIQMRSELIDSSLKRLEVEVVFEKNKIETLANEARSTILTLKGTPPFQGIIRAEEAGGYDEEGSSSLDQWKERLGVIFVSEMETSQLYDQLRYLDENGQELVRVDLIDGQAQLIIEEELQYKGDRDYFLDSKNLQSGEVYVSNTELNREGSPPVISEPYRPVIRYSTPIFSNLDGSFQGVLVANVLVDNMIVKSKLLSSATSNVYIIDDDGFFILHQDSEKEWGSENDLKTGINIFSEFPGTVREVFDLENGSFNIGGNFISFAKVYPDRSDLKSGWIVLELTPDYVIFNPVNKIVFNSFLIGFGTFLVLFFVFLFVIQYLLKPLNELVVGAEKIGQGDFKVKVPVHARDEIGLVAESFNSMVKKLKAIYGSLENKVQSKTKDLSKKVKELEKTQNAMTNILDDIETEKNKFQAVLESIGDGVFVVDNNLNIQIFNNVSVQLSGFDAEDVIGKPYHKYLRFVDEKTGRVQNKFIKDVFKTGEIQTMESHTDLITKSGNKIAVADSAAPLRDSDGDVIGAVVVFRDVSKERQIDRAKTEFVSLASHQLRTPLAAIRWYTEMLMSGDAGKLNKDQVKFLDEIYVGNQRMVDLVGSLLNVSRIELGTFAVEPENVDLKELASVIIKELEPTIKEKKLKIEENFSTELTKYKGDPKLLTIIFQNLLSNAVKYTGEKGEVKLTIDQELKKKKLLISVSDTGCGIPKDQKSRIFTKLFRADNVKQMDTTGTGLGLYIIKAIVEASKGRIWFKSEEGKGTTFFIELPLSGMKAKEGSKPLE